MSSPPADREHSVQMLVPKNKQWNWFVRHWFEIYIFVNVLLCFHAKFPKSGRCRYAYRFEMRPKIRTTFLDETKAHSSITMRHNDIRKRFKHFRRLMVYRCATNTIFSAANNIPNPHLSIMFVRLNFFYLFTFHSIYVCGIWSERTCISSVKWVERGEAKEWKRCRKDR